MAIGIEKAAPVSWSRFGVIRVLVRVSQLIASDKFLAWWSELGEVDAFHGFLVFVEAWRSSEDGGEDDDGCG